MMHTCVNGLVLCIILSAAVVTGQVQVNGDCYHSNVEPVRCTPKVQSFSLLQVPTVNSTCGMPPTEYCIRRQTFLGIESNCGLKCDADDPTNAHPPALMTDFLLNDESWWQSENSVERVRIHLSLNTLVEITVVAFNFVSFKPTAFYLEKSLDYGTTFEPFHYFAYSCIETYQIDPDIDLNLQNETTPICQEIDERGPGQISFFPTLGRPSANDSIPGFSEELYDFITVTDIRVTLEGHFPIPNLPSQDNGDYYYAIEDLNVVGECQCFGHASTCIIDPDTNAYTCECEHNTDGRFCDQCAPFYQDIPWQRADGSTPFECKACSCNNHSRECVFNPDIYEQTGATSGGECLNCMHNTAGRQCENCARLYYPIPGKNLTDPDVCTFCDCLLAGVRNDGECSQKAETDVSIGDCACKSKTTGRTCDQCIPGYFDLSTANPDGCQECGCNMTGSLDSTCNQLTGACTCKLNFAGDKCDRCERGYYQSDTVASCVPCHCNVGGAFDNNCNANSGQCHCRMGITGRDCSETIPGYFFPTIDHIRFEGEEASGTETYEIPLTGSGTMFTGRGYFRVVNHHSKAEFGVVVPPASGQYDILFRYNLQGLASWDSVTLQIETSSEEGTGAVACGVDTELPVGISFFNYTSWEMGIGLAKSMNFCLRAGRSYTLTLQDFIAEPRDDFVFLIDSGVVIATNVSDSQVLSTPTLSDQYRQCVADYKMLQTQPFAASVCEQVTFAVSSELYNGTLPCYCNVTGTEQGTMCTPFGGQCSCLPMVRERQCDTCETGSFGFSNTGCTSCECNPEGSESVVCDPVSGACPCMPNYDGRNCSMCTPNYWGQPALGCMPCQCNTTGSSSLDCDQNSGLCTCKMGVVGDMCNECEDLHYDFSESGCRACNCSVAGTTDDFCDLTTGQCSCKVNTEDRRCSQCIQGTFNLQASNPSGCQPCYCSGLTTSCTSATGYIQSEIRTIFNFDPSDPLGGWTIQQASHSLSPVVAMGSSGEVIILMNSSAYLQAPTQYLGYRLSSYGQFIRITFNSTRVETQSDFDLVLMGDGTEIGYSFEQQNATSSNLDIHLHESQGWINTQLNRTATALDLQRVLSSLTNFQLTASYINNVSLVEILLESTTQGDSPSPFPWVEVCSCPQNYSGLSCERCALGYTRNTMGDCQLCQCNGFSSLCDEETGLCFNCSNFTTGPSCSECIRGTYGNPTSGIPCQVCPCPLASTGGLFADDCSVQNDSVVCLNCLVGHTGERCEECLPGYFGDPLGHNGTPTPCSDCLCSGNIDDSIPESCDVSTGLCLLCLNNTAGAYCEECAIGFYGDAVTAKNCTECGCNMLGSRNTTCNQLTGQCDCKDGVVGLKCDQCATNYYGIHSGNGCQPCQCNTVGARHLECDVSTGQCDCYAGVTGQTCDHCIESYFGFSSQGCQRCNCSGINSLSSTCDSRGLCTCNPGATGSECKECIQNHYQTEEGCSGCPDCYQELDSVATKTMSSSETVNHTLTDLVIHVTPFESALTMQQREVEVVVEATVNISSQHQSTTTQFDTTSSHLQQLSNRLTQIDNSLTVLKAASTTVIVLASTTEELMDRTTEELLVAQDEISKIASQLLPGVQMSSGDIASSFNSGFTAAKTLTAHVQLQAYQLQKLYNITTTVQQLPSVGDQLTELTSTQQSNTKVISTLQDNWEHVKNNISSLRTDLSSLATAVTVVASHINDELDGLSSVPKEALLSRLILKASDTKLYAQNLMDMVTEHQSKLDSLVEEVQSTMESLSGLVTLMNDIGRNISTSESIALKANSTVHSVFGFAEQVIHRAEYILGELQAFSNDSFQVASRVSATVASVEMITDRAIQATNRAQEAYNEVQQLANSNNLGSVTALEAVSVLQQVEENVNTSVTGFVVAVVAALNTSTKDKMESVLKQTEASEVLQLLHQQARRTANLTDTHYLASNSTSSSMSNYHQTKLIVHQVCEVLHGIDTLDVASLNAVRSTVHEVSDKLFSNESVILHSKLREMVVKQQERRHLLGRELQSMAEEVKSLKQLLSTIPNTCKSL